MSPFFQLLECRPLLCLLSDLVMTVEHTHTHISEWIWCQTPTRYFFNCDINLKLVVKSVTYMKSCMTRVYLLIIGWFCFITSGKRADFNFHIDQGLNRNSKFRRGRRATRWTKCIQGRVQSQRWLRTPETSLPRNSPESRGVSRTGRGRVWNTLS